MFCKVQDLTQYIDNNLKWLEEGIAAKDLHDKEEYEKWLEDITNLLKRQIVKLKEISCNEKLIVKYESKVNLALSKIV